jgi:hypothetical protein
MRNIGSGTGPVAIEFPVRMAQDGEAVITCRVR